VLAHTDTSPLRSLATPKEPADTARIAKERETHNTGGTKVEDETKEGGIDKRGRLQVMETLAH